MQILEIMQEQKSLLQIIVSSKLHSYPLSPQTQ